MIINASRLIVVKRTPALKGGAYLVRVDNTRGAILAVRKSQAEAEDFLVEAILNRGVEV